jgi:hypothetical protein
MLTLLILLTWTAAAPAESGILHMIPEDAAAGFVVRNVADLRRKGDRFLADTEMHLFLRPSELFPIIYSVLGLQRGVEENNSAAILVANPEKVGIQLFDNAGQISSFDNLMRLLVIEVPFADLDDIGANFGIARGAFAPGKIVPGKGQDFGKFFAARGKHLFIANHEATLAIVLKSKPAGLELTPGQRRALNEADMLIHLGIRSLGPIWKDFLKDIESRLGDKDRDSDPKLFRQLMHSLASLRYVSAAIRIDGGLSIRLLAGFPQDKDAPAQQFLRRLQAGPGAAELTGLPDRPVVAVRAAQGDGAQNATVMKLLLNLLLNHVDQAQLLLSSADRPNFVGVFTEVWKRLKGSRAAVYRNADESRFGLFGVAAILDTEDPEKFLAELAQLAHYGGSSLDLSAKAPPDDAAAVARLIQDLGAAEFSVRESATIKLCLIGEPVLPYLEKALASDDLEVHRRAERIKEQIVTAAALRRQELLANDLTRHLRPTFAYIPRAATRAGQRIDVIQIRLSARDAAVVPQLRQLFGPDWDRVRLAVHGKQVVALLGSDDRLLVETFQNLKEHRPGLAGAPWLDTFARKGDPARKFEFHVSLQTGVALKRADDLKDRKLIRQPRDMTSVALTIGADWLQLDAWIPNAEFKVVVKEQGW